MRIRVTFEGNPTITFEKFIEQLKGVTRIEEQPKTWIRGQAYTVYLIEADVTTLGRQKAFKAKVIRFAKVLQGEGRYISLVSCP